VCWNRGVPRPLGALRRLSRKSSRNRRVDRAGTRLAAGDDPGEQRDVARACTATTWDLPGCTRHSGRRRSRQRAGRYRRPVHWPLSWSGWAVRIRSGPSGCAATDRAAASTGSGTGDDSSSSGGSAASVCVMALTYDEASELAVLSASGSPRRPRNSLRIMLGERGVGCVRCHETIHCRCSWSQRGQCGHGGVVIGAAGANRTSQIEVYRPLRAFTVAAASLKVTQCSIRRDSTAGIQSTKLGGSSAAAAPHPVVLGLSLDGRPVRR